jgi:polyhydroxybutyrate depolymerase
MLPAIALTCARDLALVALVALVACGGDGSTTTQETGADTGAGTGGGSTTQGATTDAPTSTGGAGTGTGTTMTSEPASSGDAATSTTGAVDPTTGEAGGSSSTGAGTSDSTGDGLPDVVPVLPSAGCGLRGSPTGHLAGLKTSVDGVDRSYDMFVPKPYDVDRAHAVIFSYHGVGGTANTNQFKLDTFSTANAGYSINVAPQGWPTAEWNENHFVPFALDASLQVFDQVLDKLAAEYCIDLNRVFVTGHSNGGQMAFHLGCLRADRVRAVFPSGGRCFSYGPGVCDPYNDAANQCNGAVMVMSVMGEDDVERHADEEATVAGFVARQGCDAAKEAAAPAPCQRFTGCDAGKEVTTCRIPGLAHQIWKDGLADVYAVMMSL